MSRWEKLSSEEKLKKKKIWEYRKNTLNHFEIPPYSTPPRNAELDVSLDSDNGEEEQEVLDDLENEEQEEKGAGEVEEQGGLAQESIPHFCVPCQGDICRCEDSRQVTFFTDEEEYYVALDVESNIHHGGLDQDERYWSSEEEDVDEDIHSEVPGVDGLLYQVGEENVGVDEEAEPEAPGLDYLPHRLYNTKYGSLF